MCRNFPKKRGELPILNLHIMKEPGRSCLVERVLPGAETSLQNIARHEQEPEWLGDPEPVQRWYCVPNTTGPVCVSSECERPVLPAERQSQTTREAQKAHNARGFYTWAIRREYGGACSMSLYSLCFESRFVKA